MPNLHYRVVIHDFHGFMTHHPHRAVRAFYLGWLQTYFEKPPKGLIIQFLNRPREISAQEMAKLLAVQQKGIYQVDHFTDLLKYYYKSIYLPNLNLINVIRRLAELDIKQVVLTNGEVEPVREILARWGILDLMIGPGVFGRENTPGGRQVRPKPKINITEAILAPCGIKVDDPTTVLLTGDYEHDLTTAVYNRMHSALLVVVSRQYYPLNLLFRGVIPNHILLRPQELLDAVLGLNLRRNVRLFVMLTWGLKTQTTRIWERDPPYASRRL